ncbi:MAG TPA: class I SAM-dependent methyltransferase, partial [Candidatus Scalindua sp.]|nr:class I SAM-dependent methyltransferase [Candidatus Scalindua sp.]
MVRNEMEERIVSVIGSAMFGPKGAEDLRIGPPEVRQPRTLGAGWLLYGFVRAVVPDIILEVGMGGSTFCMLPALRHNGKGHLHEISYDPAMGKESFRENAAFEDLPEYYHKDGTPFTIHEANIFRQVKNDSFEDLITIQLGKSCEYGPLWDTPLDMLVVDSSHIKEDTLCELDLIKWLKPGGYAFFHDFTVCDYNVGYIVEEYVNAHEDLAMIVEPDYLSMAIIQRKYTFDADNGHSMSGKESAWYHPSTNPQAYSNEVQSTDGRKAEWIKPWTGRWIKEPEDSF